MSGSEAPKQSWEEKLRPLHWIIPVLVFACFPFWWRASQGQNLLRDAAPLYGKHRSEIINALGEPTGELRPWTSGQLKHEFAQRYDPPLPIPAGGGTIAFRRGNRAVILILDSHHMCRGMRPIAVPIWR